MGSSVSAFYDDAREFESALEKVGLKGDKKWGSVDVYSTAGSVIVDSARKGLSTYDTIRALHKKLAEIEASKAAELEISERNTFDQLKNKY